MDAEDCFGSARGSVLFGAHHWANWFWHSRGEIGANKQRLVLASAEQELIAYVSAL